MSSPSPDLLGFISVVSAAVNTGVWDVVYLPQDIPLLVVYTEERMKWWVGAKEAVERVFQVEGYGDDGIPLILSARPRWFSPRYGEWRCRVLVVEPPVSFGFVLLWAGMDGEAQGTLAGVMQGRMQEACGVPFRVSRSGVVYEVRGKSKEPVDFATPWSVWYFLEKILGEPKTWYSFRFPVFLRSYCPWGM